MNPPPLHEALLEAIDAFTRFCKENRIEYAFMGGVALQAWSRQRATRDIDAMVSVKALGEEGLVRGLRERGFGLAIRKALGHRVWLRFHYRPSRFPLEIELDLFPGEGEYQRAAIGRSVRLEVMGRKWRVVSPEDLILQKLMADRILDRADVRDILADQGGALDWRYLSRWAGKLGLSRRLAALRARRE